MSTRHPNLPGQEAGVAPPMLDPAMTRVDAHGVRFSLRFLGEARAFSISRDTLAAVDGRANTAIDLLTTFLRHQTRIVGVAGRSLRAGAKGDLLILSDAHFSLATTAAI